MARLHDVLILSSSLVKIYNQTMYSPGNTSYSSKHPSQWPQQQMEGALVNPLNNVTSQFNFTMNPNNSFPGQYVAAQAPVFQFFNLTVAPPISQQTLQVLPTTNDIKGAQNNNVSVSNDGFGMEQESPMSRQKIATLETIEDINIERDGQVQLGDTRPETDMTSEQGSKNADGTNTWSAKGPGKNARESIWNL